MHVYFYGPASKSAEAQAAYGVIKKTLNQAGLWVSTNTESQEVQVSSDVLAEARHTGAPLLEQMDAFIVEGTISDPQIGFLLAHAIAQNKPALYLYRRGTVPQIFQHLSQKELPKDLKTVAYTDSGLARELNTFLQQLTGTKVKQVPRHKFTLRITDAIEEFLYLKTNNTKKTKAEFLREKIEEWMEHDKGWQQHDRRRRTK